MRAFLLPISFTAIAVAGAPAVTAADIPLGSVEKIDGERTWLRFTSQVPVPGTVVALYGQPTVERHPLTGDVIISRPTLIAKVQVIAVGALVEARTIWKGVGVPAVGQDALPLPFEAAPDAPPGPTAALPSFTAQAGQPLEIKLPLSDPDRQAVVYRWALADAAGHSGRLEWSSSREPMVRWWAPSSTGASRLLVSARDPLGQEWKGSVELTTTPAPAAGNPSLAGRFGGENEPALQRLMRLADGRWLGVATDRRLIRLTPGWATPEAVAATIREPVASAARGSDMAVIEGRSVIIVGADFAPKSTLAGLSAPTDIAVAIDGAWLIADQKLGGIAIIEADGRFRCLLGRSGEGSDDFTQLTRLAVSEDGTILALDMAKRTVHRFDRFLKRLTSWTMPNEVGTVVDLAASGNRVVVLADDGRMTLLDDKGRPAATGNANPSGLGITARGTASDLCIDGDQAYVTWPESGLVTRSQIAGAITGLRGAPARNVLVASIDGNGALWSIDSDKTSIAITDSEGWRIASLPLPSTISRPESLAALHDGSGVILLDTRNQRLTRITRAAPTKPVTFSGEGKNPGQLVEAVSVVVDGQGRSYVLDADLCRVSVFDAAGGFAFTIGSAGKTTNTLRSPKLLAVSPDGSQLYVYDANERQMKAFAVDHAARSAAHRLTFGGKGDEPAKFRNPTTMIVDRRGAVIIADSDRKDIQSIDAMGSLAQSLWVRAAAELGIRPVEKAASGPDGALMVLEDNRQTWLRW